MLIFTQSMLTTTRLVLLLVPQIQECRELRVGQRNDVSALSTIATVRAAARNKLFSPEADAPAPAITGDDTDFDLIDELHFAPRCSSLRFSSQKKAPERGFLDQNCVTRSGRRDVNPLSFLIESVVSDNSVDLGEQRKVPTHANVPSRVDTSTQLPDKNVAGPDCFAAENFHSASLSLAVAAVAGTSSGFLMGH